MKTSADAEQSARAGGRLHEAAARFRELLDGTDRPGWRAVRDFGLLLEDIERMSEAREVLELAVALAHHGSPARRAEAYAHLARVLERQGALAGAERAALRGIHTLAAAEPPVGLRAVAASDPYAWARDSLPPRAGLKALESTLCSTLGRVYGAIGRSHDALVMHAAALALLGPAPHLHLAVGDALAGLGSLYAAINHYNTETHISPPDPADQYLVIDRVASAQLAAGLTGPASRTRMQGVDIATASNNRALKAVALTRAAEAFALVGDLATAVRLALHAIRSTGTSMREQGAAHGNLGVIYLCFGEYDKALRSFRLETRTVEPLQDPVALAAAATHMAEAHLARGDAEHSLTYARQASQLLSGVSDAWLQKAAVLGLLASALAATGQLEAALQHAQQQISLLSMSTRPEPPRELGEAQLHCGDLHARLGQHDLAHRCYTAAAETAAASRDPRTGVAACRRLGDLMSVFAPLTALSHYEAGALLCCESAGDARTEAYLFLRAGQVALEYGWLDRALALLKRAAALYDFVQDSRAHADACANICSVHICLGNFSVAIGGLTHYLQWCRAAGDLDGEVVGLANLGHAMLAGGRACDAIPVFRRSAALADQRNDKFAAAEARLGLAQACAALEQARAALRHTEPAVALYRELLASYSPGDGGSHTPTLFLPGVFPNLQRSPSPAQSIPASVARTGSRASGTLEDIRDGLWTAEYLHARCSYAALQRGAV
jgi:tetratricopeptide (TPR) repeat protein